MLLLSTLPTSGYISDPVFFGRSKTPLFGVRKAHNVTELLGFFNARSNISIWIIIALDDIAKKIIDAIAKKKHFIS